MKIDAMLQHGIGRTKEDAASLEAAGYDGVWNGETSHDPFLQLLQVAEATDRVTIGTSIAIAFGRTPLTLAHTSFDMARYAEGRFVLGIGSQIKPHIERRFSMPWSHPAKRMREFVLGLRAIWAAWQDGEKLDFRGEFYTHTLMTPFFSPEPHAFGPPPVFLAGVGELMTEVAGETCDGFFVHPFTTRRYLEEVTLPALHRGRGERGLDGFTIAGPAFTTVGRDDAELAAAIKGTKQQIAFYGSTPAYKRVLELADRPELQPELTKLSKEGRWVDMGELVDDELLHLMAVVGEPAEVGRKLVERWGDVYTRLSLYTPYPIEDEVLLEVAEAVRAATSSGGGPGGTPRP
jgi:probable F420-dependent oxidoreductase